MNKHVMNFTELFESISEETSTEDLIVLAETGIIPWKEVIDTAFDRGDLAVGHWLAKSTKTIQPTAVFTKGRVEYGKVMNNTDSVLSDVLNNDGIREIIDDIAYRAGAKMTISIPDVLSIKGDNDDVRSIRVSMEDTFRVRSKAQRTSSRIQTKQATL